MSSGGDCPVVLIVEDVDYIRVGMRSSVERYGCVVLEATDDEEALSIAGRVRPRLLLTEEELPTLGRLVERIRRQPDLCDVPIVIVNPDEEEGAHGDILVLNDFDQLEPLLNPSAKNINRE